MSRVGKQQLIVFDSTGGWRGEASANPIPLHLIDDNLEYGVESYINENLLRDTRNFSGSYILHNTQKPQGAFTIEPRPNEISSILYSHFQKGTLTNFGTLGTRWNFEPDRGRTSFAGGVSYGTVGSTSGDVFSVDFMRSYDTGTFQSMMFRRGVCNKLSFMISANQNMKMNCEYKFRTATSLGTGFNPVWGTDVGGVCTLITTYDYVHPFHGFDGTLTVNGISIPIETLNINSENNLLEKITIGGNNRESFTFGDYVCNGNFTLDFPDNGLSYLQSALQKSNGTITGTVWHHGSSFIGFNLPYIVYKPNDIKLNNIRHASIAFDAFERNGTAPLQVTVRSPGTNLGSHYHPNAYTGTQFSSGTWTIGGCDANFQTFKEFSTYFGTSDPIGLTGDLVVKFIGDTTETVTTSALQIKPTGTASFIMYGDIPNTDITKGRSIKYAHDSNGISISKVINDVGTFRVYNINFDRTINVSSGNDLTFSSGVTTKGTLNNVFFRGSNHGDIAYNCSNILNYNICITNYTQNSGRGINISSSASIYENMLIYGCGTGVRLNNSSHDNIYRNIALLENVFSWTIPAGATNSSEAYYNGMSDGHGSNAYWTPGAGNQNNLTSSTEIETTIGESFGRPKSGGTLDTSGTRSIYSSTDIQGSAWSLTTPSIGIYQY